MKSKKAKLNPGGDADFLAVKFDWLTLAPAPKEKLNLNKHITVVLKQLCSYYNTVGDDVRALRARELWNAFRGCNRKITDVEQIAHWSGVGPSWKQKIKAILETGTYAPLLKVGAKRYAIFKALRKIYGVGAFTAEKWYDAGINSVADVRERVSKGTLKLSAAQEAGLEHVDDMSLLMDISEVRVFLQVITNVVRLIDPELIVSLVGSCRRGKTRTSDADFVIHHPSEPSRCSSQLLRNLVCMLEKEFSYFKALKLDLDGKSEMNEQGNEHSGWHYRLPDWRNYTTQVLYSVAQLNPNNYVRRLDILVATPACWPYVMLYMTGSRYYNRKMRQVCSAAGYHLCNHIMGKIDVTSGAVTPVIVKSEKEIFSVLGIEFVVPEDRAY